MSAAIAAMPLAGSMLRPMELPRIAPSTSLANVRYEIRGELMRRAGELKKAGHDIVELNIGNPGLFGFQAPEAMRRAVIENFANADAYSHQKGIFPAREAVVMQQQERGVRDVTADDVFLGNGCSELIVNALRALLNPGDEVLIPSPDYPLWTAATNLAGGTTVHYPCPRELGFVPDVEAVRKLVTPRTRALVVINPNNPTGAVYPKAVLEGLAAIAEEHNLVLFSDEIYDRITYDGAVFTPMATIAGNCLVGTFAGLSKVYRACGWRVGWLSFSGPKDHARDYLLAIDKLCALRLCSNVPGQWAVQTALGGYQSIHELTRPGGRLYETRKAVIEGVKQSKYLDLVVPNGALYAFLRVKTEAIGDFSDARFALDLLEKKHVLITPGKGFNVPYADHFRITLLPEASAMTSVFAKMDEVLADYARGSRRISRA
jgi:alanine-synthesizing transaminase